MTTTTSTSWTEKLALAVLAIALSVGSLQWVASSLNAPAPETVAAKRQHLAAEETRAQAIRSLAAGEVQYAEASAQRTH